MHRLLYPLMALVPAAVVLAGFSSSASAATPQTPASQSARGAAIARDAIKQLEIGQHAIDQRTPGPRQVTGLTQTTSTNWAGYADTGSGYSEVTGSWTEPAGTCSGSTTSLAAFWVGLDGYSSSSVEQDGTLIECYGGTQYQYTWWEMYPANSIQLVGVSLKAGDSIKSSVVRSGTSYTLKVTDATHTANSFSTTQTCSGCANSSAEWIAEAPSGASGPSPLADFGTWTEKNATVTKGSTTGVISTFPYVEISMVSSGVHPEPQTVTGPLNAAGNGFTVTWERGT